MAAKLGCDAGAVLMVTRLMFCFVFFKTVGFDPANQHRLDIDVDFSCKRLHRCGFYPP